MRQLFTPLPHAFPEFHRSLHRLFCTRRRFHKLSRVPKRVQLLESSVRKTMAGDYEGWTQQQLVARIEELEQQIGGQGKTLVSKVAESVPAFFTSSTIPPSKKNKQPKSTPPKTPKAFDASRYSTRLIALKFAYLGQKYNGFEHHNNNKTPLPTIEEELWKALVKTRVINPTPREGDKTDYNRIDRNTFAAWDKKGADVNWEGCDYSKCGRTDRGVSAFGQVIGVRVRSNRPLPKSDTENEEATQDGEALPPASDDEVKDPPRPYNDLTDELPYIQLLNRVLPPDIRIYAWCPNPPPDFSARFSCKERRYKYFFTDPCFAPVPGSTGLYSTSTSQDTMREGWLDIEKMRQGCEALIGLHDFRNFCKIDASKQLTNFKRRIFHASIEQVSPLSLPSFLSHPSLLSPSSSASPSPTTPQPKIYAFNLHGSAFLWHQVRNIVATLFLIGQGHESPSLIPSLLDITQNPTRPKYEMASDAPLVLWDCIFPHDHEVQTSEEREHGYTDRLKWVYVGDEGAVEPKSKGPAKSGVGPSSAGKGKWGRGGVVDDVWEVWRGNKIDETLSALLLDRIAAQGEATLDSAEEGGGGGAAKGGPRLFDGGNVARAKGTYTPVLLRERQESVEVVNERYAKKKGLDPDRFKAREEDADE